MSILDEFSSLKQEIIIPYLKKTFGLVSSACCLYHMIEKGEDIYIYLIDVSPESHAIYIGNK